MVTLSALPTKTWVELRAVIIVLSILLYDKKGIASMAMLFLSKTFIAVEE